MSTVADPEIKQSECLDMIRPSCGTAEKKLNLEEPWRTLAIQRLNEVPDLNVQKCAKILTRVQKHHPKLLVNAELPFILRFLRLRKFDLEKAYKQLVKYYEFKREEKLCQDLLPSEVKHVFKLSVGAVLPKYDKHLRKLFVVHIGQWDPSAIALWDALRAALMVLEVVASDPASQITGFSVIVDFKGFTFRQLSHVNLNLARTLVRTIQDTVPVRVKALYFINASSILASLISTIKLLLSSKIRKRFHVLHEKSTNGHSHNQESILREEFGAEILPTRLGGEVDDEVYRNTCDYMLQQENYFKQLNQFGFQR